MFICLKEGETISSLLKLCSVKFVFEGVLCPYRPRQEKEARTNTNGQD